MAISGVRPDPSGGGAGMPPGFPPSASPPLLLSLDDPAAGDPDLAGGKAAALAKARAGGLATLPGVVLTTAFSAAIDAGAPVGERAETREAFAAVDGESRPLVVRSSSTIEDQSESSMAGRFESVISRSNSHPGSRPSRRHASEEVPMTAATLSGSGPPAAMPPTTLAIDVGGTGLKASVLDAAGAMVVDQVRVKTTYPCPPDALVRRLHDLVAPLPAYDRVSVGFPGMVRGGRVLTAPNLSRTTGPGSRTSPELVRAWAGFDLASALEDELGRPTRVVNDADLQGAAAVEGKGLELVITLGTGFGTGLFHEGCLCPHLELAHQPFRQGETYEQQLGDVARKRIGDAKWNRRLKQAVANLDALFCYDRLFIGGGNSRRVRVDLGPAVTLVDNAAGILGGIRLWERSIV